jgi:hypothetical protein
MTTRTHRNAYLDHAEITATLQRFVAENPQTARLQSIGTSSEGRELWVLVVGKEPERTRPALWLDGNMHAMEMTGSCAALAFAEDLLAIHRGEALGLSAPVLESLRESLVYVLPRMSPDGAECVLKQGRYVRSLPLDDTAHRQRPRWKLGDVDGDGCAFSMRVAHPSGDFVESKEIAGLMLPRAIDDEGPFYRLYPEGTIENWDGHTVPTWRFFDDNPIDLNRNFPWGWAPEGEQIGAGLFPMSSPEARAVVEFTSKQPHLMAWINLHTFGGVCIRPLGDKPDNKMDVGDLNVYRQIERWFKEHLDYPTVSGFEEFLYEPDKPLKGDVSDYAYYQLGCMSCAVELWDLFARAGLEKKKRFVEVYEQQSREELTKIARWDRDHNQGRTIRPWKKVTHPQLGVVEVGGLDVREGVWNPPREMLGDVCARASQVFLRMTALLPRLHVETRSEDLADGARRVEVIVENRGYLPTHGLWSAAKLALSEPIVVDVEGALGERRRTLGHLDGWGHGLYGKPSWPYQASVGAPVSARASFVVRGRTTIRVGSARTGFVTRDV